MDKHWHVVCCFAEPAAGPGWANSPIWIIARDGDKKLHEICVQPEEQTAEMLELYSIAWPVHEKMRWAGSEWLKAYIAENL